MSDQVEVPFKHGETGDQAVLLLAAAEELGLDPNVISTTTGGFVAPQEVVDKAFGDESEKDDEKPAKKAAKKATAKKAQE